jgi:hypothetical protein
MQTDRNTYTWHHDSNFIKDAQSRASRSEEPQPAARVPVPQPQAYLTASQGQERAVEIGKPARFPEEAGLLQELEAVRERLLQAPGFSASTLGSSAYLL